MAPPVEPMVRFEVVARRAAGGEQEKIPAWGVRELPRDGDICCLPRLWEKKPDAGFKLLPERLLKLQWMADASPPACRTEINAR